MRKSLALTALLAVLVSACGGVDVVGPVTTATSDGTTTTQAIPDTTTTSQHTTDSTTTTTTSVTDTSTTIPAEQTSLVVYFLAPGGETGVRPGPFLVPVHRTVPKTQAVARAALNELLAGPTAVEQNAELSSAVPSETLLLDVAISDGLATVDLSGAFDSGGGTFSQMARLAQVVYTVTQFSTVDRVEFRLDGQTVEVFSSEGIVLDGPVDRDDYLDLVPLIMVESPAYGGTLGSKARITGTAAVFEAVFHMKVTGPDGDVLAEPPYVMTDEGAGWGSFDVTLDLDIAEPGWGTLTVWNASAEDGSIVGLREYPVYLDPKA